MPRLKKNRALAPLSRATWTAVLAAQLLGAPLAAGAADIAQLDKLTPSGAEKGANKDGSIPAWQGAEAPLPGWEWGKLRRDFWKHKDEKPLFSIDASNADKYADKLSAGQLAMLKQRKDYRMDVYPSHRTCGVPDFVAANTRKNVGTAKLSDDGWSLKEATVPGYPFPIPASGVEAMWNSKMRYRGVGIDYKGTITAVSPRRGSTEWIRADSEQTVFIPTGAKGSAQLSSLPPVEFYVYFGYVAPAALAGQAVAITQYLNQAENETFYYFPGQRRVRRMPAYSHDAPQIGMENQYTLDEPQVFNGALDRFDWKLVGKKEIYVPYNAFGAYDFKAKFEDVAQPDFIAPSHRRYELHRVWVIDATVKAGMRHSAPKRTIYLDEDSWAPLLMDDFDGQNKLAKMREGFLIPVYETGSCDVMAMVQNNLASGNAGVLAAIDDEVEKSELPMMLYVYAAIVVLVFAVYRDLRAVIACCLPLTVGTFIGYWFMKELQIGLTVATLPVMVLAVGIGVDYAFYIYNRLLMHLANGQPMVKAVENSILEVGTATIFTAITLAIGVATWSFSQLKFQADMGKLLAFMFMVNMVMAMTALPAVAVWLERLFPRRKPVQATGLQHH